RDHFSHYSTSFVLYRRTPNSTLFPYTTLFRSAGVATEAIANSYAILCDTLEEAVVFSNRYAPEHLIVETDEWEPLLRKISNAGSDRKSTRLNSSHVKISYAVFCLKKNMSRDTN